MNMNTAIKLIGILVSVSFIGADDCGGSGGNNNGNDLQTGAGSDVVVYSYLGVVYTVTDAREVSAVYSDVDDRVFIYATPANKPGVSLSLEGIRGPGTYELRQGSVLDELPDVDKITHSALLTRYDDSATPKPSYSSLFGPDPVNGAVTISQYEYPSGNLVGTFFFTGGDVLDKDHRGTAVVADGSFRFRSVHDL